MNLTQQLVHELGKAIVKGDFHDGALPSEAEICETYNVSRTSTREAVKMLTAKGLVSSRPRQGIRIQERKAWNMFDKDILYWMLAGTPDLYTLRHFLQLRAAIEPQAALLAAQFATEEDVQDISAALVRMKSAEDGFDDTLEADIQFHCSIMTATNNPFFVQLKKFVETALRVNIRFTNRNESVTTDEYQAHVRIFEAIAAGDSEEAWRAAMATQEATMALVNAQIDEIE